MRSFYPAIVWAGVILWLSVAPENQLPNPMQRLLSVDKVAHALAYAVLAFLVGWGRLRQKKTTGRGGWLLIAAGTSGYGAGMELIQFALFPYRNFELYDILANIIGCFIGLFTLKLFFNKPCQYG